MSIKPLIHTLLAGLLILTGCQGLPTTPFAEKSSAQTLSQTVQTSKGPYTGPLNLKINTGLIAGTSGKMIDLLPQSQGFQTQALPQGPIVFSETLNLSRKDQDFSRSFKIPDTSKRYLVHIAKQEPQRGREGRVQVNLNGAWVIREKDFERGEEEFQTTGLLLNANNVLKIRFKGKVGSRLTVTVVEAGEAGTILRRRGWEKDRDLTQADRIRNNDTNIFDPNDPDSLGGLEPYEGDEPTQNPSNPQRIGLALANQTQARIAVGEVRVLMREPIAANLQALQARFPVLVREAEEAFGDTFATLQVKFEEVDLGELANHIQTLNQRPDILSLREVIFSSVNTAKTISAALEIQAQAQDLVQGANLVTLGEKHSPVDFDEQNTPLTNDTPNKTPPALPVKASSLWWLESIKAREAWDYSLGEGATVAVIDDGFGYIEENPEFGYVPPSFSQSVPSVKSRIVLSTGVSYLKQDCKTNGTITLPQCAQYDDRSARVKNPPDKELQNAPGHGLATSSFLGASQDNKNGIVGVAPGVSILPMYNSGSEPNYGLHGMEAIMAKQLERLYNENVPVDVVSISIGRDFNALDLAMGSSAYIYEYIQTLLNSSGIKPPPIVVKDISNIEIRRLIRIIGKLSLERKVIFVTSGGNNGRGYAPATVNQSTDLNFPSCLPFVLGVGAYENVNGNLKRANFQTFIPTPKVPNPGSDYGPQLAIWAPGTNMWVQNQLFDSATNSYKPSWKYWEGTSHATPLVAGTVALMKSINKNLTHEDIYAIIRETSVNLSDPSFTPSNTAPYPIYGLRANWALEDSRVGVGGISPAKTYTFKVQNDGLEDIANKVPGNGRVATFRASNFAQLKALYPVLEVGQTIEMTGWTQNERSTIPANQIHVQKLQKVISTGGFQIQSIASSPPVNLPSGVNVWITRGSRGLRVNPSQLLGIGLSYPELNGLEISVDNQKLPIRSLAQDYVTFGIPADMTPGVKDVLLTLAGNTVTLEEAIEVLAMPPLQQVQSLPTQGGLGLKSFSIGQNLFLAFANFYNGSTHAFQSPIFRWDGSQFQLAQNIPTNAAYDIESFEMANQSYLAIANYGPAYHNFTNLYRWNGNQFVLAQQIPTQGGTDSEYFSINGEHYLAIANRDIGYTEFNQNSRIYKWNGAQFSEIQSIPTRAAYQWEHQQIGNQHFLTLVNYDSAQGSPTADIYLWNGTAFAPFQTLPSNNSLDAEAFNIGSQYFLAISNYDANYASNTETLSWLYRWDGSQFQPFQSFLNKGAHHWRYFNKDGVDYLILANDYGGTKIYRWEGQRFELYRTLVGEGAWAWEFMQVGGQEYLIAVSQYSGPQGYNTPSTVYKFE